MLLSAVCCTVATICIKIVHVVKVLRVRVKQFGGVERSAVVTSRDCNNTNNKSSRREFAQAVCLHCKGAICDSSPTQLQ
jgi:hypothetical protein